MALLTADDVLNKDFDTTKFREGYDQDQVDEFLDEVVATLNALTAENAELRSKLAEAEQRVAELTRQGAAMQGPPANTGPQNPGPPVPAQPAAPTTSQSPVTQPAAPPLSADTIVAQVPPATLAAPAPMPTPAPSANPLIDRARQARKEEPESATQMLALAQRLHDEYVRSGQEEGEKIIAAAKAQAAGIVREAEEASVRTMGKLEQERSLLERKIETLRIFERDYRTRLKSYLENLLTDLEGQASSPATPSGGQDFYQSPAPSGEQPQAPSQWNQAGGQQQRYRPFGG